jgi:hypothetical protein
MGEIMQYAENERQVKFGLKNEFLSEQVLAEALRMLRQPFAP